MAYKSKKSQPLSGAKDLALRIFMAVQDSSSPAAPQNDSAYEFFATYKAPPFQASQAGTQGF
jgi:hypothetical protein